MEQALNSLVEKIGVTASGVVIVSVAIAIAYVVINRLITNSDCMKDKIKYDD